MKLNYKRTVLIGLAFMTIGAFWQIYDYVIPLILQYTFRLPESVTGVVMAADNILALVLLPLFGTISDKTDTRIGRRMPYILFGTLATAVLMLFLPIADSMASLPFFIAALFLVLLAVSVYRSPAVALMPDLTPRPLRSLANAIINLMGTVGAVYVYIIVFLLLPTLNKETGEKSSSYLVTFIAVAAFMIAAVIALYFTVPEKKLAAEMRKEEEAAGIEEDRPEESEKGKKLPKPVLRSLIFILLSVAFWYIAYNSISSAFSRYVIEVWDIDGSTGAVMLLATTVVSTFSFVPFGILSSKIGRKKGILLGVTLMFVSTFCGSFITVYSPLAYVMIIGVGLGWALINVNGYPMAVEMAGYGDVGKSPGIYYTFSMSAQIAAPILSGALIQILGYKILFPFAAAFMVLAFVTMTQVRHGDQIVAKKENALEYLSGDDE